jgi:hypothetical protein
VKADAYSMITMLICIKLDGIEITKWSLANPFPTLISYQHSRYATLSGISPSSFLKLIRIQRSRFQTAKFNERKEQYNHEISMATPTRWSLECYKLFPYFWISEDKMHWVLTWRPFMQNRARDVTLLIYLFVALFNDALSVISQEYMACNEMAIGGW